MAVRPAATCTRSRGEQPPRRAAGGGSACSARRLNDWTRRRRTLAGPAQATLPSAIKPIAEREIPATSIILFPVRASARQALQAAMTAAGVETLIHYPVPLNEQRHSPRIPHNRVRSPLAPRGELLLPLHPGLRTLIFNASSLRRPHEHRACPLKLSEGGAWSRDCAHHRRRRLHRSHLAERLLEDGHR